MVGDGLHCLVVSLVLLCAACGRTDRDEWENVSVAASREGTSTAPTRNESVQTASPLDVGLDAAGSLHRLRVGQTLRIHLQASPATGYGWVFAGPLPPNLRMESDPGFVTLHGVAVGPGDMQTWTFRAERSGTARLRFLHARPWESHSSSASLSEFEVAVQ